MTTARRTKITNITSAIIIFIFVYTATAKLMAIAPFREVIRYSAFSAYAEFLSYTIPVVELIAAGLLFFPSSRLAGLILSLLLMMIFTAHIIGMMLTKDVLPCSCGGFIETLSWKQHLWLNGLIISLIVYSIISMLRISNFYYNKQAISRTPVEKSRHSF